MMKANPGIRKGCPVAARIAAVIAVFFGLIFIVWRPLFMGGQVPVDMNMLRMTYPGWTFLHQTSWPPLWNPYRNLGEPFWADPQSMAAYPLTWLLQPFSFLNFLRLWVIAHAGIAAFFMRRLVRLHTASAAAGGLAALLAAFNGLMAASIILPNHFAAAAYLPMVFYCLSRGHAPALGIALALQWMAGFPPYSMLTMLGAAGFVLTGASRAKTLIQGLLWGAGLAAIQWVPFVEFWRESVRSWIQDPAAAGMFSLSPGLLTRLVFLPQWMWSSRFLPIDPAVGAFYVGPIAIVLSGVALLKGKPPIRRLGIATLAAFVLSLGDALPFFKSVGVLHIFRFPAHWLFLASFGLTGLAAAGLSQLKSKRLRWAGVALVGLDLLVFAQPLKSAWFPPEFLEAPPPLAEYHLDRSPAGRLYHSGSFTSAWRQKTFLAGPSDYAFMKESLVPSLAMAYRVFEADGFQVLRTRRADEYLKRMNQEGVGSPVFAWAGIATVVTMKHPDAPLGPSNVDILSSKEILPSVFEWPRGKAQVTLENRNPTHWDVHVETPAPMEVVFRELHFPGWQLRLDGERRKASLFEDTFMKLEVPAGEHDIQLRYLPASFLWGSLLSALAWMGLIWGGLRRARRDP